MTRMTSIGVGTLIVAGLASRAGAQSPQPPAADTTKAHASAEPPCNSPACQPLLIIDGMRADSVGRAGGYIRDLEPSEIDSIKVMRGPEALRRYGDAARNVVLFVWS